MPLIDFRIQNETLIVELNDPGSRNALSLTMADELRHLIDHQSYQAVLLTNKGSVFCAGGHLTSYAQMATREQGLAANQKIRDFLNYLFLLPVPKVVYVNGLCVGGGVELVSCFDRVVAHPAALFGLWQRRIGLSYGWGGESRLQKRMTSRVLKQWFVSSKTISVYQAKNWGLVDEISPFRQGLSSGLSWITKSLKWGKNNLNTVLDQQLGGDQKFEQLWLAPDHKAILDQRK